MNPLTLLRALCERPQRPLPARLPELTTDYRLDRLPLEDIARYRAAFGFAGKHIPLTWWYLPAQRAHLATMLDPRFPFRVAGLVHMENALDVRGFAAPCQALVLRTGLMGRQAGVRPSGSTGNNSFSPAVQRRLCSLLPNM